MRRCLHRPWKPPALASTWQTFLKCVLHGKEVGAHICVHDWLRISVGVGTRIPNEQTLDDIISRGWNELD